jgi:hypothetical protein
MATTGLDAFNIGDPTKVNLFNAEDQDRQEYVNALNDSLTALQNRYANPNWFKIAAGFAKPQLGGFMAGLGSASEAMGDYVEQQRASELPIAQIRGQLALAKIGMNQNQKVADAYSDWREKGSKPEELMQLRDYSAATAPNAPVTQAIQKRYESMTAERQLAASEQNSAGQRVQLALALHQEPNPADIALLQRGSPTLAKSPARGQTDETPAAPNAPATRPVAEEVAPAIPKMKVNLQGELPQDSGQAGILSKEYVDAHQKLYDAVSSGANDSTKNKLMGDINALKREMQRANVPLPNLGTPSMESARAEPAQKTSTQQQASSEEKFPVLHRYPTSEELRNLPQDVVTSKYASAKEQASMDEDVAKATVANLAPFNNPTIITPYMQSLKKTKSLLANHPTEASKVHDVLNNGDLQSQILSSIQKGGTVSYGGLMNGSISVSLPAETWERAGLPKNLTSYANDLSTEYMKQMAIEARMKNQSMQNLPVAEFTTIMSTNPNLHTQWDSSLHNINQKSIDAWYQQKIGKQLQDDRHKFVSRDELAPYASTMKHSKSYQKLQDAWNHETENLSTQREQQLFPR